MGGTAPKAKPKMSKSTTWFDESSKLSKKDMEIDVPKDDDGWGRNRDNPALARQDGPLKKSRQN